MIRFSELLVPFEASYPDLTAMLGHMAENFKYSELLAILEKPDGSEDRHSKEYRDDL